MLLGYSSVMISQEIEEEIFEEEILDEDVISEEIEGEQQEKVKVKKLTSELSGNIRGDYRYYPDEGLYIGQQQEYVSAVFNPEIYLEWANGKQRIQFKGFGRLNQYDNKQTHVDLREFYYQRVLKKWEISIGVKQIYWGFTESNHLVNVINQDDVLEGNDIENKLGQPMGHISVSQKWGTVDFMVMPYFRKVQFPGIRGRGRPPFLLDEDNIWFESENEEYNPDLAIRWFHNIKSVDIGLSHFYGTSRVPFFDVSLEGDFTLMHELINQTGLEFQATTGAMLWKLEAINRVSERKTIKAFTVGAEYTFSNVFKTDLGFLLEYNYDDRGAELINGLNDDVFMGMRIGFNDKQSTDFLGGINVDAETGTMTYFAEANRRLGDSWKLSFKMFGLNTDTETEFFYLIRKDGFVEASLSKYF